MHKRLVSLLLMCALILLMTNFDASCTHQGSSLRGSSFEGPVAEAWAAQYSNPDAEWAPAHAYDVAVDTSGNVYVAGHCGYPEMEEDYITIKYDASGEELWSARYDGPGGSVDSAEAVAVDASGNVYVTGYSSGDVRPMEGGGPVTYDYATVKYSADGAELWVARYNGPADTWDHAFAIGLDAAGSVYVTGQSGRGCEAEGCCASEYATIKYDGDGNELWVARYHGPVLWFDTATAMAVGADGSVYVTGSSGGRPCEQPLEGSICAVPDYATIKYDPNGAQVWVARYSDPAGFIGRPTALAVDGSGNVYVTGGTEDCNPRSITVKYDSVGCQLWTACYEGPASQGGSARDMAVDALGYVYVAGTVVSASECSDTDCVTVKYDQVGGVLWTRCYASPSGTDGFEGADKPYAIAVDGSGNVYVTGSSHYESEEGEQSDVDSVTIKYDTNGTQLWLARYNGSRSGWDTTTAIALDADGNVYVAGSTQGGDGANCLTIKYVPE